MADVDQLAQLTVAMVTNLARRGKMVAGGVALITLLVGGLSYLTGLAALEGSAAEAWAVIGGAMLIVAVGAPLLAWWRLSRVSKDVTGLVGEVGRLITNDPGAQRVVIETVTVDRPDATGATTMPAIVETRQFGRLHQATIAANLRQPLRRPARRDLVPLAAARRPRPDARVRRPRLPVRDRLDPLTALVPVTR